MDDPPPVPANPFEADSPTAPPACLQKNPLLDFDDRSCPQKALLDFGERPSVVEAAPELAPAAYNNGHANGNGDIFAFLDRPIGRKAAGGDDEDEADDSGSESGADSKDEVSPAPAPPALASTNPFGAELELASQQQADEPSAPRQETPTPPADDVPGVVSDNVAESGEESEDEWDYIQVKPTENVSQTSVESLKQTNQPVCQERSRQDAEEEEDMESQLNPNAAEFVPSPTLSRPIMEEFLAAQSKENMDDVVVPSSSEFQQEVSLRPSDLDFESSLLSTSNSTTVADTSACLSNLMNGQDKLNTCLLDLTNIKKGLDEPASGATEALKHTFEKELSNIMDESGLSTKANCGDESANISNLISDFQKTCLGGTSLMEASLTESDFIASGFVPSDKSPGIGEMESSDILTFQHENNFDLQKEPMHISFELQKEIAPKMESQPERVKVDSDEPSPSEPEPETELQPSPIVSETLEEFVPSEPVPCEQVYAHPESSPPQLVPFVIEPETPPASAEGDPEVLVPETPEASCKVDAFSLVDVPSIGTSDPLSPPEPELQQAGLGQGDGDQNALFLSNPEQWRCEFPLPPDSAPKPEVNIPQEDILAKTIQGHNDVQTPDYEKLEEELEALEAQEAKHLTGIQLENATNEDTALVQHPVSTDTVTCEGKTMNIDAIVAEHVTVNHEETALRILSAGASSVQEESAPAISTPPPTPAPNTQAAEAEPLAFPSQQGNFLQAVEKLAEAQESSVVPADESAAVAVTAAAATAVVAATTAAVAIAGATPEKKTVKKEATQMKKQVLVKDKKTVVEKPKIGLRTSPAASRCLPAAKPKSPTSPLKPLSPLVSKTSTVRKTATSPSVSTAPPATKTAAPRTTSGLNSTATSALSRPKSASSTATKPSVPRAATSSATAATSMAKPRPVSALADKKALTNGDISKQVAKRPDQLATKTGTTRLAARPATAPAAKLPVKSSTVPSALNKTRTSTLNGPAKPKMSASSAPAKPGVKAVNEKEIKESANKQISSTRTTSTTSTMRSTATGRTTLPTSTTTRKIEAKPMTNGRVGAATKPATGARTAAKLPAKKPSGNAPAKTAKSAPSKEKSETVEDSSTANTTNEVKTEGLIENAQPSA